MRPRPLRLLALALLPLLLPALPGCDDAGTNLFTFTVDNVSFTFTLADLTPGATMRVDAQSPANILGAIRAQGFGPEEVERVRLVPGEAQIRILNAPSGADIGFLDDVSLRLRGGGTTVEVASAEGVSGGTSMLGEADLDVRSVDIAPIVTAGDFGATLDASADDDITPGLYRVEVRFDVEVAVQGF